MNNLLSIQSLFDLKSVSAPAVNTKRKEIAFVETIISEEDNNYISQIMCLNFETKTIVSLTNSTSQNFAPTWSTNGERLYFISTRTGKPQVYMLNVQTGGEAIQLTDTEKGVSNYKLSPLDDTLFYTTSYDEKQTDFDPEAIVGKVIDTFVYKTNEAGFINVHAFSQIYMLNLASKKTTQITSLPTHHTLCDVNHGGTKILFTRDLEPDNEQTFNTGVFELDITTKMETHITAQYVEGTFSQATYNPTNNLIAFMGTNKAVRSYNIPTLFVYNPSDHSITDLLPNHQLYIGDCAVSDFIQKATTPAVQWIDGQSIMIQVSNEGTVHLFCVMLDGNIHELSQQAEHILDYTIIPTTKDIVAIMSTPTTPNELIYLTQPNLTRTVLYNPNEQLLTDYALGTYLEVKYTALDGGLVHGYLVQPSQFDATQKYPIIINIHGGPHAMHAATFHHEVQTMAAKGYAVLLLNPRGSHGYGQKHVEGVLGHYGEEDYTDLMLALDGVIADYNWIDSKHQYVTGGSYGGFMTNWIVTQTDRFRSAVTQRSISNWISMSGTSDIGYYFDEWEMQTHLLDFDKMWQHSPLKYVNNVKTPLLILHAEEDYRCPMEQAEQFYTYLKHLGQTTRLIRFPKSTHDLSRTGIPSLRVERLTSIFDWFETYK